MSWSELMAAGLLARYRYCLMCGDDASSIEDELSKLDSQCPEEQLAAVRKSAEKYKELLESAYDFGGCGVSKNSLKFQQFIDGVRQLNDPVLTEAAMSRFDRGWSEYLFCSAWGGNYTALTVENGGESPVPLQESSVSGQNIAAVQKGGNVPENDGCDNGRKVAGTDAAAGDARRKLLQRAFACGRVEGVKGHQKDNNPELEKVKQMALSAGMAPENAGKIVGAFYAGWEHGRKKAAVSKGRYSKSCAIRPLPASYDVHVGHGMFLRNVQPSGRWRVFIDETGSIFDQKAVAGTVKKRDRGRFVAFFVPGGSKLPPLGYHHACDASMEKNESVLNRILGEYGHGCAILGVTLEGMAQLGGMDYWCGGIARIFELTLRLLPDSEHRTVLEFYIENRGESVPEAVKQREKAIQGIAENVRYQFAKSFREKADKISIMVKVMAKKDVADKSVDDQDSFERTFEAYNGYVDTLAYAWNSTRCPGLRQALEKSGVFHRCLLEGDNQELPLSLDRIERGDSLSAEQWTKLLNDRDYATEDSLVSILLGKLGENSRRNVEYWRLYVNETVRYLNSKAIDMRTLGHQLDWLSANMPATASMPKRLRLLWLTSKLAEANHRGVIASSVISEIEGLMKVLFVEEPQLCCYTVLHMAVERTNAYRFEEARDLVRNFAMKTGLLEDAPPYLEYLRKLQEGEEDFFNCKVAIFGLRYCGQILSSLGQHEAFLGNHEKADSYFEAAIKCFERLSDDDKGLDIQQTMSYKVINLMDWKPATEIRGVIEQYLGGELPSTARRMAVSDDAAEKYRHAILLRYLMLLDRNDPAVNAYLSVRKDWKTAAGHPWEIIGFYRALLVEDAVEKMSWLITAFDTAAMGKSGGTLKIIAAVILGAFVYYQKLFFKEFKKTVNNERALEVVDIAVAEVPALDQQRVDALRHQVFNPVEPLKLARIVLPFNFR